LKLDNEQRYPRVIEYGFQIRADARECPNRAVLRRDVANAALFPASGEANFITGVALPVDGGALVNIN
jgi:NAD(P)-dependent dehydrogenase (short-subunit alcohol dehydrogenase family)